MVLLLAFWLDRISWRSVGGKNIYMKFMLNYVLLEENYSLLSELASAFFFFF